MISSVYNSIFESRRQRQCTRLWEHLEAHLVRELSLGEGEGGLQVLPQDGAVSVALDGGQDLSVNCSLISLSLLRGLVGLLLGLEDISLLLGLLSLNPGEVLVVDVLGDGHLRDVELGGGGDQVPLVHPPQWAAVKLVGSSDEEEASAQLLQDNNTLAFVDSS